MKGYRLWKAVKILVMVVVCAAVFGLVVMQLWNWLMPAIFGLRTLTFVQALGLLVLSKVLFGGFHRHGHGGGRGWRRGMGERWEKMTPEERERFKAGMRGRRGGWCEPRESAKEEAAV
ncbi:hypothetical protein [Granulicella tundricola]|uniref:Uncharacterized protein n=1 Tax=Granulicella tundricola (strain ATCC BAA-1859 / DSM 23138 / MP5ACTX9) TaxID=1198114 RepID=E8WW06_GRATM|nr:hypothetical protein [Granulicella tundricola]ADW67312.1 hypothetical protein AciX9_0238 [Granulicella tundricola MP5ACTX9]